MDCSSSNNHTTHETPPARRYYVAYAHGPCPLCGQPAVASGEYRCLGGCSHEDIRNAWYVLARAKGRAEDFERRYWSVDRVEDPYSAVDRSVAREEAER